MREAKGMFPRLGGQLAHLEEKTKSSALSVADSHSLFLDSDLVDRCVRTTTWDVDGLRRGDTDVFLILPADKLKSHARLLRLWVASFIRVIARDKTLPGKELWLLLDEAGQLGFMDPLVTGLTLMRGFGLRMVFFFQSLGQLKEVFRDKESILLDNTEQLFFGTNSLETAKRVSEMAGQASISVETGASSSESRSYQSGGYDPVGKGVTINTQQGRNATEMAREIIKPDEVLTLDGSKLIAFLRGLPGPVMCNRILYYRDKAFAGALKGPATPWVWLLLIALAALAWWFMRSAR
jgi:type IV secretion system protein VirD4